LKLNAIWENLGSNLSPKAGFRMAHGDARVGEVKRKQENGVGNQ